MTLKKAAVHMHKYSRYDKHIDKLQEVDEIEDKLQSKNEGKYTEQQIRMWAHLIHMNKHTSHNEPLNKKFWKPKSSGVVATWATTSYCRSYSGD